MSLPSSGGILLGQMLKVIEDYDIKSFLKLVIKENLYKKNTLIKNMIFEFFEFYFRKKVNLAKSDIINLEAVTIPLQLQRFANSPYKSI